MMAKNIHKKIYFHEIGKPQSEDLLVYERPNHPKQGLYAWVTEDGKYLLIQVSQGTDTKTASSTKILVIPHQRPSSFFPTSMPPMTSLQTLVQNSLFGLT